MVLHMKIIQIVESYRPEIKSPHPPANIIEGLWRLGHDVDVYTSTVDFGDISQLPKRADLDVGEYASKVNRSLGIKLGSKVVFPGLILRVLGLRSPDVVHTYVMGTFSTFVGGYLKKVKGYPLVVTADFDVAGFSPSLLKTPYVYLYSKLPTSFADTIIAFTQEQKNELMRHFKFKEEKIKVVPIGIDFERFASAPDSELRKELGLEDKFVVFNVSFITPKKNIEMALRAVKSMRDSSIVLVHIGGVLDRDYKKKLDDMVRELGLEKNVKFLGPVSLERLPDYYEIGDAFLQTGFRESFCIPILEAMASGLPVVTTRVGIASEVTRDGETGFIAENETEIADKLRFLMENPGAREEIGSRNVQVAKGYDWKNIIEKIFEIYSSIT